MLRNQVSYRDIYSLNNPNSYRLGSLSQEGLPFSQSTNSGEFSQSFPNTQPEDLKMSFLKEWQSLQNSSAQKQIPSCTPKGNDKLQELRSNAALQDIHDLMTTMIEQQKIMLQDMNVKVKSIMEEVKLNTEGHQKSRELLQNVPQSMENCFEQLFKAVNSSAQDVTSLKTVLNSLKKAEMKRQRDLEEALEVFQRKSCQSWEKTLENSLNNTRKDLRCLVTELQKNLALTYQENCYTLRLELEKLWQDKTNSFLQLLKEAAGKEHPRTTVETNTSSQHTLSKRQPTFNLQPHQPTEMSPWTDSALLKLREIQDQSESCYNQGFQRPVSRQKLILSTPRMNTDSAVYGQRSFQLEARAASQRRQPVFGLELPRKELESSMEQSQRQPLSQLQVSKTPYRYCEQPKLVERNSRRKNSTVDRVYPLRSRKESAPSPALTGHPRTAGTDLESSPGISCCFSDVQQSSVCLRMDERFFRKASNCDYSKEKKMDNIKWF